MITEKYEMALENFERSLSICKKEQDAFSILSLNKKMAVVLRRIGRLDESLELLFDMFDHYHLTNNPEGTVGILTIMAEVYIAKGEIGKAVDAYRTVAAIHKNFKHKRRSEEFAKLADELEQE
jgi:tetratricopeptide (TPR) repeat protein